MHASIHEILSGRELLALLYRLARNGATGVVTASRPGTDQSALILRRGQLVVSGQPAAQKRIGDLLRGWAAEARLRVRFDGGAAPYPPGMTPRVVALDAWIVAFFQRSMSSSLARQTAAELAGARIGIRPELAPRPEHLDDADRRVLDCLAEARRLDEIPAAARAPRFRVLALLFALRELDALALAGVAAPHPRRRFAEARRVLGLVGPADRAQVKRAYRRLARALHPDLRPELDAAERRALESKLAEINRAYRELIRAA